jgi:hypothetical protein
LAANGRIWGVNGRGVAVTGGVEEALCEGEAPETEPLKLWRIRKSVLKYKCKIELYFFACLE